MFNCWIVEIGYISIGDVPTIERGGMVMVWGKEFG